MYPFNWRERSIERRGFIFVVLAKLDVKLGAREKA
jgi:hypothetical protein